MVGLNGLEPSTSRLSGVRSNQLSYRPINLERVKGIELSSSAWKAEVLPLNYTRKYKYGATDGNRTHNGITIRCVNHFATTDDIIEPHWNGDSMPNRIVVTIPLHNVTVECRLEDGTVRLATSLRRHKDFQS